jgi:tripartite-type tricarboxylate transporter receptor subunit TctC
MSAGVGASFGRPDATVVAVMGDGSFGFGRGAGPAGMFVLHVPYGGGGPAVQAVLGDVSQLTLLSYAALKGQIAAGKIKPLAVTGAKRLPDLPNVPTVAESDFPGFEAYS